MSTPRILAFTSIAHTRVSVSDDTAAVAVDDGNAIDMSALASDTAAAFAVEERAWFADGVTASTEEWRAYLATLATKEGK